MRKLKFNLFFGLMAAALCVVACSDDEKAAPDDKNFAKGEWSETMTGRDGVLGQYPDLYSNYWEFTWNVAEAANVALKFEGQFPIARYFSFSLYNDNTGDAIGGMNDYEMVPDAGNVNPFQHTTNERGSFTVYLVPSTATQQQIDKLGCRNVIKIPEGVKQAAVVIRHYLGEDGQGNYHEFGGVQLPTIKGVDITTGWPVDCPKRVVSNVSNITSQVYTQESDEFDEVPFYLSPTSRYYPNNSTKYLYARTRLHPDEVLHFAFITPPMPQRVEDYANAPTRYWSVCLGSAANTRSYLSLCDKDARVAPGEEKTHFVVTLKSNPRLEQIKQFVEAENEAGGYYNLFVWDSEQLDVDGNPIGDVFCVMYRNILANPSWEHSIAHMTPTNYKDETGEPYQHVTDSATQLAHLALGDYGPVGEKASLNKGASKVGYLVETNYYYKGDHNASENLIIRSQEALDAKFGFWRLDRGPVHTIDFNSKYALAVVGPASERKVVYSVVSFILRKAGQLELTYKEQDCGYVGYLSQPQVLISVDKKYSNHNVTFIKAK